MVCFTSLTRGKAGKGAHIPPTPVPLWLSKALFRFQTSFFSYFWNSWSPKSKSKRKSGDCRSVHFSHSFLLSPSTYLNIYTWTWTALKQTRYFSSHSSDYVYYKEGFKISESRISSSVGTSRKTDVKWDVRCWKTWLLRIQRR